LELAIWKSKITEQHSPGSILLTIKTRMQYQIDSVTMVNIIIPNMVSFLSDGGGNDTKFWWFDDGGGYDD
jgi:hypothetical protein